MSYGDYETVLELDGLGPCLIIGEIIDESEEGRPPASNGSGKSTIINTILWCLFGRTMHSASPGDRVINHVTGRDCVVTVEFKSGDEVRRTRNLGGRNELVLVRNGHETKSVADTLATAKLQQQSLNRTLGLDWELFCGSSFFTQYSRPWMEMADAPRRKAIERALHLDRLSWYADVAKHKIVHVETEIKRLVSEADTDTSSLQRLQDEERRAEERRREFEERRSERADGFRVKAAAARERAATVEVPDLDKLRARWELIAKVETAIDGRRRQLRAARLELSGLNDEFTIANRRVNEWQKRINTTCPVCEQDVKHDHVGERTAPLTAALAELGSRAGAARTAVATLETALETAETKLRAGRPTTTVEDAEQLLRRRNALMREANELDRQAEAIAAEVNPYDRPTGQVRDERVKLEARVLAATTKAEQRRALFQHYTYVQRAYSDRNRIKLMVFDRYVGYLNDRLSHYLDALGLDVKLSLNPNLSITTNMWGYDFQSGGERKRTDLAFMFAMFDLHGKMHGRQCNVLVLDEVDGRMDDAGTSALVDVINNDLAAKVETVLVISHKDTMRDVFPRQVLVERRQRLSYVREAR